MRNSKKMSETRYWMFSRGIKERNRKKRRLRRIGLRIRSAMVILFILVLIVFARSTRWPVGVRPENSTKISWTRVRKYFTMGRSATLTADVAVDLFQQYILKQGDQVRADGSLCRAHLI